MPHEIRIETPRLMIRRPTLDDLQKIHAAKVAAWPELQKWMSWAFDSEAGILSTRKFIEGEIGNPLCGFRRDSGDFIIATGIDPNRRGQPATGYWVAPDYLGHGYATESTNAVIRYAFEVMKVPLMAIDYYEGNDKSRNVIEKLGFTFERKVIQSKARCLDGKLLDVHHYIMHDPKVLPPLEVSWN